MEVLFPKGAENDNSVSQFLDPQSMIELYQSSLVERLLAAFEMQAFNRQD